MKELRSTDAPSVRRAIIVKLREGRPFPRGEAEGGGVEIVVHSLGTDDSALDGSMSGAEEGGAYDPSRRFQACFVVRERDARRLARRLESHQDVEGVYVPARLDLPSGEPATEPAYRDGKQQNLDAMGVPYMWNAPGGLGENVQVADVEIGWYDHPDLQGLERPVAPRTVPLETGDDGVLRAPHGTQVLTVVAARANGFGMVGVLPSLGTAVLSGVHSRTDAGATIQNTPWAVRSAANSLTPGDVMLIEVTLGDGRPLELESPMVASEIVSAIERGVVVIAAAGNRTLDLNLPLKAIHVGSSWQYQYGPGIDPNSNRGPAVDCCAWGQGVLSGISGNGQWGYGSFSNTSAAASMVAGVVAGVQSVRKTAGRRPLSHDEVRTLLRTPGVGSPPIPGIGMMPHAGSMIQMALGID